MRQFPNNEDDMKEAARLEAPVWMLQQLKLNPSYVYWGPHEDYMWKDGRGWDSRVICDSWKGYEFGLDDLNEVVNFYFEINRPHKDCENCAGKGSHPDAQWITESWYSHSSPFTKPDEGERQSKAVLERFGCQFKDGINGRGTLPPDEVINRYGKAFLEHCVSTIENGGEWYTNITQDEVEALREAGRLWDFKTPPTADEVNQWARRPVGFAHDAINAWICQKRRCQRLGVPLHCLICEGHGHLFTGPAYLSLIVWVLHPRKGCSRGVEINHIREAELPEVYTYLRAAAERNAQRFSLIPALIPLTVK